MTSGGGGGQGGANLAANFGQPSPAPPLPPSVLYDQQPTQQQTVKVDCFSPGPSGGGAMPANPVYVDQITG